MRNLIRSALLLMTAVTCMPAAGQQTYRFHNYGEYGYSTGLPYTSLADFNNRHEAIGTTVGYEGYTGVAALNFQGSFGSPQTLTSGYSVNNLGDIAGSTGNGNTGRYAGVVIGGMTRVIGPNGSTALSLNDAGNALYQVSGGSQATSWLWNRQLATSQPVKAPNNLNPYSARAMNNQNLVVGSYFPTGQSSNLERGFAWDPVGGARAIATPAGLKEFTPSAVNDSGWIAGVGEDTDGWYRPAVVAPDGSTLVLDIQSGSRYSVCLNNLNQLSIAGQNQGYLWNPTDGLVSFDPVLDPTGLTPGWLYHNFQPTFISDDGWICGYAVTEPDVNYPHNATYVMMMLEPVPGPGTGATLLVVAALPLQRSRRILNAGGVR